MNQALVFTKLAFAMNNYTFLLHFSKLLDNFISSCSSCDQLDQPSVQFQGE